MEHSEFCKKQKAAQDSYMELWPKACKTCGATGSITYQDDPSPSGVSLSPGKLDYSDPCPDCCENGLCPRCGETSDINWDYDIHFEGEENGYCKLCGWFYKDEDTHMPYWECSCYENEIDDYINQILGKL